MKKNFKEREKETGKITCHGSPVSHYHLFTQNDGVPENHTEPSDRTGGEAVKNMDPETYKKGPNDVTRFIKRIENSSDEGKTEKSYGIDQARIDEEENTTATTP